MNVVKAPKRPTRFRNLHVAVLVTGLLGCLAGCSHPIGVLSGGRTSSAGHVVDIGYQAFGTLRILKASGRLEKALKPLGYTVAWHQFLAGPPLMEALNAGKIDLGHVGETPPLFALAGGVPFVILGMEPPSPRALAIIVPRNSRIKTLADLKGKTIALVKGTVSQYLVISALNKAGLSSSDVTEKNLLPPDARAAFEQGSIDAWAIWDPYRTSVLRQDGARVLSDCTGLMADREFYVGHSDFVKRHPAVVKVVLEQIRISDASILVNRHNAAVLMAKDLGIDIPTLDVVVAHRNFGEAPVTAEAIDYEQRLASLFYKLGILPKSINVKASVYTSSAVEPTSP